MRATLLFLILVALAAGPAACNEAATAAAGSPAVEEPADRCDDAPQAPAAPAPSPFDAAAAAVATADPRLAPVDAPARPPDALPRRAAPARAVPLRL